jgi:hypothetical protein
MPGECFLACHTLAFADCGWQSPQKAELPQYLTIKCTVRQWFYTFGNQLQSRPHFNGKSFACCPTFGSGDLG